MMKTPTQKLLDEVEEFLIETGDAVTSIGHAVTKNGHLLDRLRAGGSLGLDTAVRLKKYMAERRRAVRRARKKAMSSQTRTAA